MPGPAVAPRSSNPAGAPPQSVRVMIVDESSVIRDGLCTLLAPAADIEVVAATDSGARAVHLAAVHGPHVLVTGLHLRGMSCLDLLRRLDAERLPVRPRLVVFAQHDNEDMVKDVLQAPTHGLLVKDTSREELAGAVRAAARGEAVFSPSVSHRLVEWYRTAGSRRLRPASRTALKSLTIREREVLRLIAEGLSPLEMADRLCIGEATVRTHVYRLRTKLELKDRAQLVAFAYQAGVTAEEGFAA